MSSIRGATAAGLGRAVWTLAHVACKYTCERLWSKHARTRPSTQTRTQDYFRAYWHNVTDLETRTFTLALVLAEYLSRCDPNPDPNPEPDTAPSLPLTLTLTITRCIT